MLIILGFFFFWAAIYLYVNLGRLERNEEVTGMWIMTWPLATVMLYAAYGCAFELYPKERDEIYLFFSIACVGIAVYGFILGFYKEWPKSTKEKAELKAMEEQLIREQEWAKEIPNHPCWDTIVDDETMVKRYNKTQSLRKEAIQRPIL